MSNLLESSYFGTSFFELLPSIALLVSASSLPILHAEALAVRLKAVCFFGQIGLLQTLFFVLF
jgi:hypothetical protein